MKPLSERRGEDGLLGYLVLGLRGGVGRLALYLIAGLTACLDLLKGLMNFFLRASVG